MQEDFGLQVESPDSSPGVEKLREASLLNCSPSLSLDHASPMRRDALLSPLNLNLTPSPLPKFLGREEQDEQEESDIELDESKEDVPVEEPKDFSEVEEVMSEDSIYWIRENFQPKELCSQIKIMKAFEEDTNHKLKTLEENDTEDTMEEYIKAEEREISKRRKVIELLGQGKKYYDSLYHEADIVATAYSNFSKRVKNVAVKLAEQQEGLGLVSSPAQAGDIER